uniref:Uncharacterized protein n=1 Tax=Manihot esculenta TaxID=3983 RepID=A0A2C9V1T5_MANES
MHNNKNKKKLKENSLNIPNVNSTTSLRTVEKQQGKKKTANHG